MARKIMWMCVCVHACVCLLWFFLCISSFPGLSAGTVSAEGEAVLFRLDVICSHIILSNRNKKQPERFPEKQLAHANRRLLILILVVMTFPQLPHWPESHFLALLSALLSWRHSLVSYFDSPEKNHEQVGMWWFSQMLGICRKCHLNL